MTIAPRLAVSTWSLHRTLGRPAPFGPPTLAGMETSGGLPLLDLPAHLAQFGIHTLEICHFHLLSRSDAYLANLRTALDEAGVALFSLLIDGGDVTDPVHGDDDEAWIAQWLPVAATLGASCARVIAGQSAPSPATVDASVAALARLADRADELGVRLMTENWHALMATPEVVTQVMTRLDGRVGLCCDFGNWRGPGKYDDLAAIAPWAESCHAKCHFATAYAADRADFIRCLEISRAAGFSGPYTLIYDGPNDDEWAGLTIERAMVQPYLA